MKNLCKVVLFFACLTSAFTMPGISFAQMVSPSIDQPGQPFSYFSKPTGEIGVMGAEAATEITPEGYLRTGFAELMFFAGPDLVPTSVRIRTLEQGHLPIIHYEFVCDGIAYRFTIFETRIDLKSPAARRPRINYLQRRPAGQLRSRRTVESVSPANSRRLRHRSPLRRP